MICLDSFTILTRFLSFAPLFCSLRNSKCVRGSERRYNLSFLRVNLTAELSQCWRKSILMGSKSEEKVAKIVGKGYLLRLSKVESLFSR